MDSPIRLFLIRHAEVEARYQRVFGGRIDMDLSPAGHGQAQALAEHLAQVTFDAIFASPMKRVRQSLAKLIERQNPPPVFIEELREVDFGAWTGLTWDEVRAQFNVSAFQWLDQLDRGLIAGAEPSAAFRQRIQAALEKIFKHSKDLAEQSANVPQESPLTPSLSPRRGEGVRRQQGLKFRSVAVVCHGGVIRMMLALLLDLPLTKMAGFDIDYASVTVVERFPHKTEVRLLNFAPWRDWRS
ncbi:MAG: histidine phosphatase family protein [Verrucomicrobia bacterium]|nr:histidine phosphatase family protein [Verrucomicrobiota bacterium]